jgi:hypothetical protein
LGALGGAPSKIGLSWAAVTLVGSRRFAFGIVTLPLGDGDGKNSWAQSK